MDKELYDLMNWPDIEGILYLDSVHPKALLGAHEVEGGILIQAYYPTAVSATIKNAAGQEFPMERVDDAGYFAVIIRDKNTINYTIVYGFSDGNTYEVKDGYSVPSLINDSDLKEFNIGKCTDAYKFMGAHLTEYNGIKGVNFAVWAPSATRVSVVGNFNNWDGRIHQMERIDSAGIFELFVPDVKAGDLYKFEIGAKGGEKFLKSDPYAFRSELRPDTASIVYEDTYTWNDSEWISNRKKDKYINSPLSIYELHLGSFRREGEEFPNYRDLAKEIISYVKQQHYTHVEFMPVMEHPLDESWGYQVTGYYSPTARYGTPDDFKYLMDELHKAGIGVILDWVPAHFPKDAFGLARFDGSCLYEHADKRKGEHPDWGTLCYNYGRREVANFLLSNAFYWAREYHADGIRIDAVASMLYLDYGRKPGEWIPNIYGGKENLEAVDFIKSLTGIFKRDMDDVLLIAEESTAWPKVTGDATKEDTLGFDYKWNMGWMNDFLYFMECDPLFRKGRYNSLTFSMIYAYTENFILSISHDEVVHGKKSLLNKMPGATIEDKMNNLRVAYAFMYTHPGKKLLFMGQDFGMENEWWEAKEIDWDILESEPHKKLQRYMADLNKLYVSNSELYELDNSPEGFEWINCDNADESIATYVRKSSNGGKLLIVANFTPVLKENYKIGVPAAGKYKEIFNSDSAKYGGNDNLNKKIISSKKEEWDGRENSITLTVPAMGVAIFRYSEPVKKEPVKKEPVKKVPVKKETEKKVPVKKETEKKEPVKKETEKKEPVKKTPVKKEPEKKEPVKKTPVKKESNKK